ncbi:MAG TPA: MOSC domain-containing protein [Candidatus Polarisedimenticolaceae bacterium]|nr:MOSC domain-containing protein [Candidatus Polarisedimenticolaceae bacterium]
MRIVSVNLGRPREVEYEGEIVLTSIFKTPVEGRVRVAHLNIDGDEQSDLTVHGGRDKAVYAYPSEHYPFWRKELPSAELPWGVFGENLTTEGLTEDHVAPGDRLRIGDVEFAITTPRLPCFKLGIRFGRPDIIKRFMRSLKSGFYLAVLREGTIGAGDPIELVPAEGDRVTIREIFSLFLPNPDRRIAKRASVLAGLPENWRERMRESL